VELVARVDKVRGRKDRAVLTITVDGRQDHEVEVVLRVKGSGLFG
jgi:hypothetical protein